MAERKPRMDFDNRTPLETVIPVMTPFVLQIEPTNICNLQCKFCPTGDRILMKEKKVKKGVMSMGTFNKIIKDLEEFDSPIKASHFYANGEPLINPNLPDMIRMGKESGRINFIDFTTNGLLLTEERVDAIIAAGLDKIIISVNGITRSQYQKNCRTSVDTYKFINTIRYLFENRKDCKVYIKSINEFYTPAQKDMFYAIFSPISDYIFIENLTNPWSGFNVVGASKKAAFTETIVNKFVCTSIFYSMVVNWDGTVSLCCADWGNRLIIGDVKEQSLKEIWESRKLKDIQIDMLRGMRFEMPVCDSCNQVSQCLYDNIDPYRFELLEKMQ